MEKEKEKLPAEFKGSVVSQATLNPTHLIENFVQFIEQNYPQDEGFIDFVAQKLKEEGCVTWEDYTKKNLEEAMYFLEDLFDYIGEIAPEGTIFGAHEGDGALFGFWEVKEDE